MTRNEYKIMRILIGLKVALTLFLVFCHPATVGCSPWTAHERLIGEISSRREWPPPEKWKVIVNFQIQFIAW